MALSLATSLIRCKGFNHADVASSYACWYATDPKDSGGTILKTVTHQYIILIFSCYWLRFINS